jgi:hypothetical protein
VLTLLARSVGRRWQEEELLGVAEQVVEVVGKFE